MRDRRENMRHTVIQAPIRRLSGRAGVFEFCAYLFDLSSNMTEAAAGAAPVNSLQSHNFHDANLPVDAEGRVYHVGVKKGEGTFIILQTK